MYSTLKNPTNSRWIQVSFFEYFPGISRKHIVGKIPFSIFRISYVTNSRETSTWKLFLDFGNPGKSCYYEIKLGSWKTEQKLCFIINKKDMTHALEWLRGVQMKPLFKKYLSTVFVLSFKNLIFSRNYRFFQDSQNRGTIFKSMFPSNSLHMKFVKLKSREFFPQTYFPQYPWKEFKKETCIQREFVGFCRVLYTDSKNFLRLLLHYIILF